MRHVAEAVTSKRFVAAVAAQRHRHVAAGHRRDVIRRNGRRVGKRLIEPVHDRVEHVRQVRLDDLRVVVGLEARGREPGGRQLVVRGLAEADGRGRHAAAERLGHQ